MGKPEIRFKGYTDEWEQRKFGDLVEKYEDPVVTPTEGYTRLGIRSHAKGTFHSYVEKGKELETAKMFRVASDKFIVNITFGWEHAVAITDENDAGKLVSHRFPQYSFNAGMIPKFFRYLILDKKFKHHLELSSPGGAGRNRVLKLSDMLEYKMNFPCEEEQRKIAETLSKVDKLIAFREQQLAKLDEVVKARFVEMFGEPSSNPMGWLQTTVGAECYYIKDGPHKSLTDVGMENGYPFISVRNIVNGYIDFSTAKYISEADYKDAIKKCCPEKGDILYSKGGTTGIAKLVDIDVKFANWVHLAVLKFNHNEFNGSFFEKMLNCDYCYKQSQMLTKGIANRDLVLSAMAQIKIYKPPILLQNQFAAFVERVDQQKQTVQQSLEKLELMKKALMQEYFG